MSFYKKFTFYLQRISKYSPIRFIIEVTALAFISRFLLVLPVAIVLSLLGVDLGTPNIELYDMEEKIFDTLLLAVIIAPFLETFIFQLLPLKILELLRFNYSLRITISTLVFAYAHLEDGLINFLGMLPIGFLFVWAFAVWQKKSLWMAIWIVFVIHGLTNLFAFLFYYL